MLAALHRALTIQVHTLLRACWPALQLSGVTDEASIAASSFDITLANGLVVTVATDLDMRPLFSVLRVAGCPAHQLPFEQEYESAGAAPGKAGMGATDGLSVTEVLQQVRRYAAWRPAAASAPPSA